MYVYIYVYNIKTGRDQGELSPLRSGNPGFVMIWMTFAISGFGDSLTLPILFPGSKYDFKKWIKTHGWGYGL